MQLPFKRISIVHHHSDYELTLLLTVPGYSATPPATPPATSPALIPTTPPTPNPTIHSAELVTGAKPPSARMWFSPPYLVPTPVYTLKCDFPVRATTIWFIFSVICWFTLPTYYPSDITTTPYGNQFLPRTEF